MGKLIHVWQHTHTFFQSLHVTCGQQNHMCRIMDASLYLHVYNLQVLLCVLMYKKNNSCIAPSQALYQCVLSATHNNHMDIEGHIMLKFSVYVCRSLNHSNQNTKLHRTERKSHVSMHGHLSTD